MLLTGEVGTDAYDAAIILDDAHGVGVTGENGRGTAAQFGIHPDILTGTFSKSFGSLGGFVCGPRSVINFLMFHARSMVYSAAITPSNAASALAALDVMETEPQHHERLWENTRFMAKGFRDLGYEIAEPQSAIIPLRVGEDEETFVWWKSLFEGGVYTNAVIPPAVPTGMSLLRTSYMASHSQEQLQKTLDTFAQVKTQLSRAQTAP